MRNLLTSAATGALLASAMISTPASAYTGSLSHFAGAGAIIEGIYTYTFVSTTIPAAFQGTASVFINNTGTAPFEQSNFQLANLAGLTNRAEATYELKYTIELYASDPTSNPDIRFQSIGLGADVNSLNPTTQNIGTSKRIVGQVTPVVPLPTFDETLNTFPGTTADNVTCGVCRKFEITDTIVMDYDGAGGLGRGTINSQSNAFDTTPLPEPGSLALFGLGFAAIGARALRRKGKAA